VLGVVGKDSSPSLPTPPQKKEKRKCLKHNHKCIPIHKVFLFFNILSKLVVRFASLPQYWWQFTLKNGFYQDKNDELLYAEQWTYVSLLWTTYVGSVALASIKVIWYHFVLDFRFAQVHFMYCCYFFWVVIYTLILHATRVVCARRVLHARTEDYNIAWLRDF